MRVLFATNPEKSIFLYLVPLAWALRTAGHEVRVASQPRFAGVITQAGLTAVPVGRDVDFWELAELAPGKVEAVRAGLPPPWDVAADPTRATWRHLLQGHIAALEQVEESVPILDELVEYARHWRPDLVVWDPLTYAGPIAAKACGAAHARLLFGIDVLGLTRDHYLRVKAAQPQGERADPLADWLAGAAEQCGAEFTEDMATGQFTIDQLPLSLATPADLDYLRMRYVPYGGPAVVPKWLWPAPERPRVALTMGLTATEIFDGYTIPLAEVLTALAGLDIEVVATVAGSEQDALGPVPDNVRIVQYVPWHALVPGCSAVIHHAGAATLATTSLHAVPQLALHYHFDQPMLARNLATHGAGLEIHTSRATGDQVRYAVQRLLAEPQFRQRAGDLRDEFHALPSPNQLIPQLEERTAKYRTC
jgi:glycosyltransferase (activator-dependent family)